MRAFLSSVFLSVVALGLHASARADPVCSKLKQGFVYDEKSEPVLGCLKQVKECSGKPTDVKVTVSEVGPIAVNHDLSLVELQRLKNPSGVETPAKKRGRTFTRIFTKATPIFEVVKAAGDEHSYCGYLTSLQISPTTVEIYIPKEFADGSCQFKTVLRHERRHYEDSVALVKEFNQGIQMDVDHYSPRNPDAFWATDANSAQNSFDARIKTVITEARDMLRQKLRNAVSDFDTEEQSEKDDKSCPNWSD